MLIIDNWILNWECWLFDNKIHRKTDISSLSRVKSSDKYKHFYPSHIHIPCDMNIPLIWTSHSSHLCELKGNNCQCYGDIKWNNDILLHLSPLCGRCDLRCKILCKWRHILASPFIIHVGSTIMGLFPLHENSRSGSCQHRKGESYYNRGYMSETHLKSNLVKKASSSRKSIKTCWQFAQSTSMTLPCCVQKDVKMIWQLNDKLCAKEI